MKKPDIYVATIIDSHNYGTVMQAAATRNVLQRYGNPIFIDYCRHAWTTAGWLDTYLNDMGHPKPVNAVRLCANAPVRLRAMRQFRGFLERELQLCDAAPYLQPGSAFDEDALYCVGSDQTWNIECNYGIDPVYFLQNVPDGCRKFSLAASFGRPRLSEEEEALTRPLLEGFDAISVRESSSVAILEHMGIHGGVALKDPVLLCDSGLWDMLAASVPKRQDGYVLLYMLNQNAVMVDYARRIASKRGTRVRIVTFSPYRRAPKGCEAVYRPKPEEWVALFRDAGLVVTDSFHGTCFSLLMERPMVVFAPPRFSVRLTDVLEDFGLSGRFVGDGGGSSAASVADAPLDWEAVRALKARFRADADAFLGGVFAGGAE